MESIAIMQPYFFPYLGYFQLLYAVDEFIFLDDVKFIKRGWINRNKFLTNMGEVKYITIPVKSETTDKDVLEVKTVLGEGKQIELLNKMSEWYSKAPYFDHVFPIFEQAVLHESEFLCDLSMLSIQKTAEYLGLVKSFDRSSRIQNSKNFRRANRIIQISREKNVKNYINAPSGKEIYDIDYFKERGIQLKFLVPGQVKYCRFGQQFSDSLSILDIMMFNSPETIRNKIIPKYALE